MKRKIIGALAAGVFGVMGMTALVSCTEDSPVEVNSYTVTFDSQSGSAVKSVTVKEGEKVTSLATPTKEGYTFGGWYVSTTYATPFTTSTVVTADITVYAKWTPVVVEDTTMTYADFMAAEAGEDVIVEGFIAAKQSWWNNSAVMYLVDEAGTGYFCYGVTCTQEEYNTKYTNGTYVKVSGEKAIYSGEHEINSGATATVLTTTKTMPEAYKLTSLAEEDLEAHQNAKFTVTLTVKAYNDAGDAFAFAKADSTVANPNGDLYFTLTDGTNDLACCVESYLTNETSDVYTTVMGLEVGDVVTIEGFMYWWNGANPHVSSIKVLNGYEAFMAAEAGAEVEVEGFIAAKQSWYNNSAVMYLVDEVETGYFCYGVTCTQEEYNTKYTVGTYVKVSGEKAIYAGEHEVGAGSTATVVTTTKTMPEAYKLTSLEADELAAHQNAKFSGTFTVKAYNAEGDAFGFAKSDSTVQNPNGDLYFTLTDGTNDLACCVESYLTNETSDVYTKAMALEVGDVVTIEGFMYWWNGANPHITSIEEPTTYEAFMAAEAGDDVEVEGFIAAKQSWWNNSAVMYLVDEAGTGYFCYGVTCTQEEYNTKYTVGTYVKVSGEKAIYAGEHEVAAGATATVVTTTKTMPAAYELTSLNPNVLEAHQNCKFTITLTVKAYNAAGDAYAFAKADSTVANPNGDLYFTLTDGTYDLACCVESYLTNESSSVYTTVMGLEVGDVVTIEGYMYWWNGANPHISSITVNE